MLIAKLKNKSILLILSRLVFTTSYSLLFNIVICIGRFYYLIFQTGVSRQNLIRPRLSAFVSCKINDLV